jgi:hypothetical protein
MLSPPLPLSRHYSCPRAGCKRGGTINAQRTTIQICNDTVALSRRNLSPSAFAMHAWRELNEKAGAANPVLAKYAAMHGETCRNTAKYGKHDDKTRLRSVNHYPLSGCVMLRLRAA